MAAAPTTAEIFEAVRSTVAESLVLSRDQVQRGSRLFAELGADSLDFIDMVFTLEKKLGVELRESELDFLTRLDLSSPEVMREGLLTRATVLRLSEWLPELRSVPDPDRVTPRDFFGLITVDTLVRILERKLA